MASSPDISVVIPTRDRWSGIRRTLAGALGQEGVNLEVVVVDDGSREGPSDSLPELSDARVRIVSHDFSYGVAAARNTGIAQARGEWIAFLDDDDLWSPRKLRVQLAAARGVGAVLAYGAALVVDPQLRVVAAYPAPSAETLLRSLLRVNVMPAGASNVLVDTRAVRELGGFDEAFGQLADWDLWIRLASRGRAAACREKLLAYVLHEHNMLLTEERDARREFQRLGEKHADLSSREGVDFDGADFSRWVAHGQRRAGQRVRAMRTYLRGALAYRSPGNLLRAGGTLLGERAMARFAPPVPGSLPAEDHGPQWLELYR